VTEYDAVFLFREAAFIGPALLERWIHWRGVPIIFDYDDAIWIAQTSGANGLMALAKCVGKTRTIARLSTHVTPGNDYLATFARRYSSQVTVVPTTIDTEKYVVRRPVPDRDPVVIGWSGSHSTIRYVGALRGPLQQLAKEQRFRLRIIGGKIDPIPGVDVECVPWRAATEVDDLNEIDVGVMPLPDDDWARGKCGLKALQYMALAIPTICSPVGVNREIVSHGVNGLHATTPEEWIETLRSLISRPDLRHRLGSAGRATVEARYSAVSQVPRLRQILEQAVAQRRREPSVILQSGAGR
jgi:glycosyltransferase involved in cell wall biosynthesis